jgi:carboxymethylenebutenolidase
MKYIYKLLVTSIAFLLLSIGAFADGGYPWTTTNYPQDSDKKWWDDTWWEEGVLPKVHNHKVTIREANYQSGDNEITAFVLRPDDGKKYPAVVFQHGRRGLDELVLPLAKRIAARGFVVLAPDLYSSHFIEKLPLKHDYELEKDTAKAIDEVLKRDDISTTKACIISHTRGGYYSLKAVTTHGKSDKVACYIATYPHWQDPNAEEPRQVYQYAPEADQLTMPVLVMIGEYEQYQRARSIATAIDSLKSKGRDAQLIVYPGVGRGFDFRPPSVRTFADDLATKDAVQRMQRFIYKNIK